MEIILAVALLLLLIASSSDNVISTLITGVGNLGPDDIRTFAANAGFSGSDLEIAVAIALAESSGNPVAVGDINLTPGGSIGLWQINLKAHPQYTAAQLTDPQTNANAAYAIYEAAGETFTPWSTFSYTGGKFIGTGQGVYLSYLETDTGGGEI